MVRDVQARQAPRVGRLTTVPAFSHTSRSRALGWAVALEAALLASWLAAAGGLEMPESGFRSSLAIPLTLLQLPGWLVAKACMLAVGAARDSSAALFATIIGVTNAPILYAMIRGVEAHRKEAGRFAARLSQPYPHAAPTLLLAALVPMYMAIAVWTPGRTLFVPELALDRAIPLQPAWVLVYGSQWVFSFLPAFVVRGTELRRRAVLAYLTIVLVAYAGFLLYPTFAPRPDRVIGDDFFAWSVREVYGFDPPYNCFPSLHVAYSFLAALTAWRVHRGLGVAAFIWVALVVASTLFTKQHYVVDVVAGLMMAYAAYWLFLRNVSRASILDADRRLAPKRALVPVAIYAAGVAVFWAAYSAS